MADHPLVVEHRESPMAVLRMVNDFGFESYDLVGLPRRLIVESAEQPLLESGVDVRRVSPVGSPAAALLVPPEGETWPTVSSRSIARLCAAFLLGEDPQRRLDVHKAATLMHQVSLVQHLVASQNLRKVLIGDEVGLGKTIEAGLVLKTLFEQQPSLRALYLAPARLVGNVVRELRDKLDLDARQWIAGSSTDARLDSDRLVVASLNKAVFGNNFDRVASSGAWNVLIVDECHHLSDWDPTGGKPNQGFRLVSQLIGRLPPDGRVILMSGTPHQGSEARFRNLLRLLSDDGKDIRTAAGRVIYRTKDRVRDWRGKPLFPSREIRQPTVVQLGRAYERWYSGVGSLYDRSSSGASQARAAGWAKGQALQWAASSVQAGLGFLARLGIRRLGWTTRTPALSSALSALRPYRGGRPDESIEDLYNRIVKQIGAQQMLGDLLGDTEDPDDDTWRPDSVELGRLIDEGIELLRGPAAGAKWEALAQIVDSAEGEKVVLFAQPVETVTVVARFLESRYGEKPALIIGNQDEDERQGQVEAFQSEGVPRFLVSSRAGGEGLNMQRARRLVHLDVPWNPMELEQRIGRIHRFGSRKTVVVDTVVAAGSREIDMYRIAREKLSVIVTHLDPEQFESLFSRVMSLVPPRELEDLLGNVPAGPFPSSAAAEIGRLVTEGYRAWSDFDVKYRQQAEQIRAISPGEATWNDLAQLLLKFAAATPGPEVNVTAFEFREEEIVAVDETLPTIELDNELFACGDTGGIRPDPVGGRVARPLGLNVGPVADRLRAAFAPSKPAGAAYLRRFVELAEYGGQGPAGLLAFLRQSVHLQLGKVSEHRVSMHLYLVGADGDYLPLEGPERARIIRACLTAVRLREPVHDEFAARLGGLEYEIAQDLRRPTTEDVGAGLRHAVWPVAAIILVS